MLVTRNAAQWVCGFGLAQLFFATSLVVCGFIVMGIFHNLSCIGIWLGLPMMVPSILSVVALGTRHRKVVIAIFFACVVIMAIGALHGVKLYDEVDFWEKYRVYAESIQSPPVCRNRGDHCVCRDSEEYLKAGYTVQYCDQFRVGEELYWAMIVLTIGGVVFSLINAILCVWAAFTGHPREEFDDTDGKRPPEYSITGDKHDYSLSPVN